MNPDLDYLAHVERELPSAPIRRARRRRRPGRAHLVAGAQLYTAQPAVCGYRPPLLAYWRPGRGRPALDECRLCQRARRVGR